MGEGSGGSRGGGRGTARARARWREATRGGGEGRVGNASAEGKTRKKGVEAGCRWWPVRLGSVIHRKQFVARIGRRSATYYVWPRLADRRGEGEGCWRGAHWVCSVTFVRGSYVPWKGGCLAEQRQSEVCAAARVRVDVDVAGRGVR